MILLLFVSVFAMVTSQTDESTENPMCAGMRHLYWSKCPNSRRSESNLNLRLSGKRGPKGDKGEMGLTGSVGDEGRRGEKGVKGDIGEADYERVRELISENMRLLEGYCPIRYNGKCFWMPIRFRTAINYSKAVSICESQGGKPANIYSEEHYQMLMEYLRTFAIKDNYMYVWLGMTYDKRTRTAMLSDGTTAAPYQKWKSGNPIEQPTYCCNIFLQAYMEDDSADQNMVTFYPSTHLRGVVCEK